MSDPTLNLLAPHVERKWAEKMVIELRLQGVAGPDIGAALAEVESHCAESRQTAKAAFGEPVEYARSLELPADASQEPAAIGRAVAPVIVQVIGSFAVLAAVPALRHGAPVDVQTGQVVWLLAFLAVAAGLVLAAESILRLLLQRPVMGMLAGAALMLLLVVPSILLPWSVAQVPALLVLVLGLVLLGGGAAWSWQRARSEPTDAIISPVPGAAASSGSDRGRLLRTLVVPAATVICAGVLLLFS